MTEAEGIPPTASVVSTSKSALRYIADFAYIYSPNLTISNSAQTILEFVTGAGVWNSRFHFLGPMDFDDPANGKISAFEVTLNNEVVAVVKCDNAGQENYQEKIRLILPPFTRVRVRVDSNDTSVDFGTNVLVTGRVYGAK